MTQENKETRFLQDIGMKNLPIPLIVLSRNNPDGQHTVAHVAISARIMQDFKADWIDAFIQVLHTHGSDTVQKSLRSNIVDYLNLLNASSVRVDLDYPFFMEKLTPASKEKCLVRYLCTYSAKITSTNSDATILFKIEIPVITTYPINHQSSKGGLFAQMSCVTVELESVKDIFPEDIVELVEKHALSPVYSFLAKEDQEFIINKVHTVEKSSVDMIDEIKKELAGNQNVKWYSVTSANYGILHSYTTFINTEKSNWIPFS
ncbi:MAG: GTP cyclohydrolase I FolE2 [Desulfuromonadales bacterium]|nr:GTP cyclohydrolase I FolE2 [Desulfuromonadales bacterium]